MPYKIGIVGAARRHQGTGPFIARTFSNLGHAVSGIIGTSAQSSAETASTLANEYNINTRGYASLDNLLDEQKIDILAICSPPDTHLDYLEQALNNNLHVFCEKPLWWPNNHCSNLNRQQYEQKIQHLIDTARQHQRIIHTNTQWPYTIRDFYRLYESQLINTSFKLKQFAMNLCPQSSGLQMVVDAASHGLSMLYQLAGQGDLIDIRVEKSSRTNFDHLIIHFNYVHADGTTQATFGLTNSQESPKPASYQINGLNVDRKVALPDYQIQLQSDSTTMNIIDPLESSIRDFIASIEAGLECDDAPLILGARHLYTLIDACR